MNQPVALNKETYDRIAEDWHNSHESDTWWIPGIEAFISMLPQGASILDVGCGGGAHVKYFAEKGLQAAGSDLSEKMIEIAKREMPEHSFYVADMFDLSSVPGEFDGLFLKAVFHHISKKDVDAAMKELKSKLTTGGLLYIAVRGKEEDHPEEGIETKDDYGYTYDRFFSYFTMPELQEIFERNGFECVYDRIDPMGKKHWLQVIGKKGV